MVLIERWQREGVTVSSTNPHEVNDAMKEQWLALAPRVAAQLTVDAGRAADAAVKAVEDALIQDMEDKRAGVSAQRAEHRAEHLDQIERALADRAAS